MVVATRSKLRIGDLLVQNDLITEEQLTAALGESKRTKQKIGKTLVDSGYIKEDKLAEFLAKQLGIPFIDLKHYQLNNKHVELLNETHARRFRVLVLDDQSGTLLIGMAEPTDIFATDALERILKRPIKTAAVCESDLINVIDVVYRKTEEITDLATQLEEELAGSSFNLDDLLQNESLSEAPVVRLLQSIFEDAVSVGASDIHIEPDEHVLRIRQRIDGILHEQIMKEKNIVAALVSRLKLISQLDISERRLPQDGRFNITVKGKSIDVRLSTLPTQYGESVVMRLLDQSSGILNMGQLGMPDYILGRVREIIQRPSGLVLLTGPTGSGKTTTLYTLLTQVNTPETKIITVEDPVEYRLPRINQVQVNTKIDFNFARVLRTCLRQDPDIIMIGEMRDSETCEIGLRAAMTGHLVFSTLHTNDSLSAANRLIDMGAAPFLVATSLRAVIAQRLARKICVECKEEYELEPQQLQWLRKRVDPEVTPDGFMHGKGCSACNEMGYKGRIGIYELTEMDEDLMEPLFHGETLEFERLARAKPTFVSLAKSALSYAQQGVTTVDEVLRITSSA